MWGERKLLQKRGVADAITMAQVPWDLWAGGPEQWEGGVRVETPRKFRNQKSVVGLLSTVGESHL